MRGPYLHLIDRMLGIDGESPRDIAIFEARLAALRPRIPYVYAMIVSCMVGLVFSFGLEEHPPVIAVVLGLVAAMRGMMWVWLRRQVMTGELARRRLRVLGAAALLTTVTATLLIAQVMPTLNPADAQLHLLMAATCAIALAAPLSPLPAAARVTYITLGVPAALTGMAMGGQRVLSVSAFNLLLCIGILLYLLRVKDRPFVEQVDLRLQHQAERTRAEAAEKVAVSERTLARELAATDSLTSLANRRAFLAALGEQGPQAQPGCVMILDLDGFKPVNDTFGHDVGDALLRQVAERLLSLDLPGATIARLGGDEFALLLPAVERDLAAACGREIVSCLSQPCAIRDALISVSACCGIAMLDGRTADASMVLRQADLALYRAKNLGRAGVEVYSAKLGQEVRRRAEIESALRAPEVTDEIEQLYQPLVEIKTGRIVAFEALARRTHSRLGEISPADFIPMTEQMQLVEPLTQALLRRAAAAALDWRPDQRLSFNLSAVQLCSAGTSERLLRCLEEVGLPAGRLQIEVTETAMMADFATARNNLAALQDCGVTVMLDDFGAGFASISYLREMHFDGLKLDGSLVSASRQPDGARLLKGVIDLARALGVPCIAEHVETAAQARFLAELECGFAQGWWFGRPVDAARAAQLAHGAAMPAHKTSRPLRQVA